MATLFEHDPVISDAISEAARSRAQLTITNLLLIVWERRWVFVITFVLAVGAIVALAYIPTKTYRVATKLMPRSGDDIAGGMQSLLGQFSGLAAIAGVGLGGRTDEQESIALLKSRALFEKFAAQQAVLPHLFPDAWDAAKNTWRSDVVRPPTAGDAWAVFDGAVRTVSQDTKTRIVTMDVTLRDRVVAAAWVDQLVRLVNEEQRQRALRESDAVLVSLDEQLKGTETVELRQAIYRLMQAQVNRKVLAKSRPDYAFAVLDPGVAPDAKRFSSPRRGLLKFIMLPFALFAAACAAVAFDFAASFIAMLRARRSASG